MKGIFKVHDHFHHVGKAEMLSTTISFFCSLRTISEFCVLHVNNIMLPAAGDTVKELGFLSFNRDAQ